MKYMLDTNICIYTIKHTSELLLSRFMQHDPDEICISSITYAELMYGVWKSQAREKNELAVSLFLSPITIIDFDDSAAREYGMIRADLEKKGTPIGPMDMLIAGHAKSVSLILVTNNKREFERVDNLVIEDWTEGTNLYSVINPNGDLSLHQQSVEVWTGYPQLQEIREPLHL